MKSIEDKDTIIDKPIVASAYIGNHLSLHMTSTTVEVRGRKIIRTKLNSGRTVVKKEQTTFIATKKDIKDKDGKTPADLTNNNQIKLMLSKQEN